MCIIHGPNKITLSVCLSVCVSCLIRCLDFSICSAGFLSMYDYLSPFECLYNWWSVSPSGIVFVYVTTVEPLTNDHPHQRPSLSYDHISCDGQGFLLVYESLTSDHPSYTTTPMWFWGWSYKRGSTVPRIVCCHMNFIYAFLVVWCTISMIICLFICVYCFLCANSAIFVLVNNAVSTNYLTSLAR